MRLLPEWVPRAARRYIYYHMLVAPSLFTGIMLPYYLLSTGYTVVDVGILYTLINMVSVPVQLALGKYFTFKDIRIGLAIIDLLEILASFSYGLARGPLVAPAVVLGGVLEALAGSLYFLYRAYERGVYPRERLRSILVLHLVLPESTGILSFIALGFAVHMLGPEWVPNVFLALGSYGFVQLAYILLFMEPLVLAGEASTSGGGESGVSVLASLRSIMGRRLLKLYVAADIIFFLAWGFAPQLALVYLVLERFHSDILGAAIAEASISAATVITGLLEDRYENASTTGLLLAGTIITVFALLSINIIPSKVILLAPVFFAIRAGDTLLYLGKTEWFYRAISREEAAILSSITSSYRKIIRIITPTVAGLAASMNPALPYTICSLLLAIAVPLYLLASTQLNQTITRT